MSREPALSIVVCTHDRRDDLERCLEAIARLDDTAEVIVVDSSSTPPCRDVVEGFTDSIAGIVYVREDRPGLSRARNRGLAVARAPIVAFVDDDAAPRPDWVARILAPFASDDSVGCVGGTCAAVFDERARPGWLSDRLLQFAGVTNFGATAREPRSSAEWPFGANIAFRVTALEHTGGFSERLGRTGSSLLSGEESALVEAVREQGWRIWLEPRAIVDHAVHAERCTSGYYWRRLWWAGIGRTCNGRVLPTLARLLVAAPIRLVLYAATRDRVHLYRTAESAGYVAGLIGARPR